MKTTLTTEQLQLHIKQYQSKYEQGKGQLALLKAQRKEKKEQLDQTKKNLSDWELVSILFTETSEFAREQLKSRIEKTVTAALQSIIHDRDLRFKVIIDKKGGQPVAEWKVVKLYDGEPVQEDVESGKGGGITDIVSAGLQLSLLELARPYSEGAFVADEPGRNVSDKNDYGEYFAEFLAELAEKTGRQILLTTHRAEMVAVGAKQYYVDMDEDENSVVSEV